MHTIIRKACNALAFPICALFFTMLFLPAVANAQWTTADASGNINNTNSNNVGVGTTIPQARLDITSALDRAQVRFGMGAADFGGYLYSGGPSHAVFSAGAAYNGGWIAKSLSASMIEANVGALTFYTNNGISTGSPFTPTARMTINSAGNIGVGTTSPNERLVTFGNFLAGNITTHTQLYSGYDTQSNVIMELGYGTATANITPLASLVLSKNLTSTSNPIGVISFANSNIADGNEKRLTTIGTSTDGALNSGVLAFNTMLTGTLAERMRITSAGNVGIGTASPAYRFDVVAASAYVARFKKTDSTNGGILIETATGFNPNVTLAVNGVNKWYLVNNATGSDALQFWDSPGTTPRFTLTQAGSLGLGTAAPGFKLDVQGGSINSSGGLCIAGDCKTSWSLVGGSQWTTSGTTINYSTGNVGIGVAAPTTTLDVNGTVNATALTVSGSPVVSSQWATSGTTINYTAGNVGVATAAPTEKLHVTGNVKVTGNIDVGGNINAKYQDMAEWVDSSQELSAGTVVVLDPTKSNQVIASTQSYDSRIAGVISLRPGLALGERGEGRVLVATTGRVKVKVDATNGPIQIGDLLVTSDKEGVAMKSLPVEFGGVHMHRPGTLIGKALEPLASGTGEILVLLSLQ
jgi:hypothetical protein